MLCPTDVSILRHSNPPSHPCYAVTHHNNHATAHAQEHTSSSSSIICCYTVGVKGARYSVQMIFTYQLCCSFIAVLGLSCTGEVNCFKFVCYMSVQNSVDSGQTSCKSEVFSRLPGNGLLKRRRLKKKNLGITNLSCFLSETSASVLYFITHPARSSCNCITGPCPFSLEGANMSVHANGLGFLLPQLLLSQSHDWGEPCYAFSHYISLSSEVSHMPI